MINENAGIILADHNIDFCNAVKCYINQKNDMQIVEIAHNGLEALQKINTFKPDIAILDVEMPKLDGLGVLERLNKERYLPTCIMVSIVNNDILTQYAYSLGAKYFMSKPFELHTLVKRIETLHNIKSKEADQIYPFKQLSFKDTEPGLEQRIKNILNQIGMPNHIRGYSYICAGIPMVINNPEIQYCVTKQLYPAIANQFHVSANSVERAIRTSIEASYKREIQSLKSNFFRDHFKFCNGKPTNSEFISFIANNLVYDVVC